MRRLRNQPPGTASRAARALLVAHSRFMIAHDDRRGKTKGLLPRTENVNSGACDPAEELCAIAHEAGAWVHVDGAFGLWLAAAPERAHLVRGVADADSWATDGHKWLNVPYDSGLVICRQPQQLRAAMSVDAASLEQQDRRGEPYHHTPENVAPRTGRRGLGGAALARPLRSGRADRAHLRARDTLRRRARGGRLRSVERRNRQPGAGRFRRRRGDPASYRRRAGRPTWGL